MMAIGSEGKTPADPASYMLVEVQDKISLLWRFVPMRELEMGSRFRLYKTDRTPVVDGDGFSEFSALSSPEPSAEGHWVVYYEGISAKGDV